MKYPYKTILCPVDFDENSMAAIAHARRIAADMGATLHLLHVLPILPMLADQGVAGVDEAASQEARRRLKDIARRRLSKTHTEIHTRVVFVSEVPRTILDFARELGADLIVMATHRRGALKHFFLGSVAEAVVRNAVCPVLTLRFEPPAQVQAAKLSKAAPAARRKKTRGVQR